MKLNTTFVSGLLMMEAVKKKIARLRPKVRYKLPKFEKEDLLRIRKIKQAPTSTRRNSDVITFL